ncbi:hypothetical protein T439DRAFT_323894 [Meredithblackwellia eburnea MCA 4105]
MPKRPAPSTQSTQSSQSQSQQNQPAKKKQRKTPPPANSEPNQGGEHTEPAKADVVGGGGTAGVTSASSESSKPLLPPPTKRPRYEGSLRRLAHPLPKQSGPSPLPPSTLSGAKVGGKSKDLLHNTRGGPVAEQIWVSNKRGVSFPGHLKKGVAAFLERGVTTLSVNAMGAAIPQALSLAMAIRDALPGGSAPFNEQGSVSMTIRTSTCSVDDEITPKDDDEDLIYQTRQKSTIHVDLSLTVPLSTLTGVKVDVRKSDTARSGRGGKSARGRGTGRGRGRGH